VAYRTISRELYGKDAGEHLQETLRGADKGLNLFEQLMHQKMLNLINTGNEAARRDLKASHDVLTKALVYDRYEALKSIIFEFPEPLPFMFAGAWSPFTDLYGNELQNGYVDELLEQIFVSSFAGNSSTMICVSWRNTEGAPGKIIAEQIEALPDDNKVSACLQLVMKHVENIFFDPDWFLELDEMQREQLAQFAADGMDAIGSSPSMAINLDADFGLPTALRSFQV